MEHFLILLELLAICYSPCLLGYFLHSTSVFQLFFFSFCQFVCLILLLLCRQLTMIKTRQAKWLQDFSSGHREHLLLRLVSFLCKLCKRVKENPKLWFWHSTISNWCKLVYITPLLRYAYFEYLLDIPPGFQTDSFGWFPISSSWALLKPVCSY